MFIWGLGFFQVVPGYVTGFIPKLNLAGLIACSDLGDCPLSEHVMCNCITNLKFFPVLVEVGFNEFDKAISSNQQGGVNVTLYLDQILADFRNEP